jgi:hypothetical protein
MKYYLLTALGALFYSCGPSEYVETREWKSIEKSLQTQLITANDGAIIDLPEGNYMFTKSLTMDGKSNITIRGKGMDKTVLSFRAARTPIFAGGLVALGRRRPCDRSV